MWHWSGKLIDVQSRTNCAIIAGDTGVLRNAQVGWTLATTLRSSGSSLLLAEFVDEDDMLYGVKFRAERACKAFVRLVKS